MIKEFVTKFEENKPLLRERFGKEHQINYKNLVKTIIEVITSKGDFEDFNPDPERIHEINDGEWQGTLLYVIAEKGYQPSTYWVTKISYGSCSGCDTLESIHNYSGDSPNEKAINEYMTLALHIVQGLKEIS